MCVHLKRIVEHHAHFSAFRRMSDLPGGQKQKMEGINWRDIVPLLAEIRQPKMMGPEGRTGKKRYLSISKDLNSL